MTNRGAPAGEKQVPQSVPPGVIWEYAGVNLPDPQVYGIWLWADGTAYPRGQYAALFKEIGTSYGAGDGNATFNVPDRRGRVGIGAGTGTGGGASGASGTAPAGGSGLTARVAGAWTGEETHALQLGELASHSHSHTHGSTGSGAESNHSHSHNHGAVNTGAESGHSHGHTHTPTGTGFIVAVGSTLGLVGAPSLQASGGTGSGSDATGSSGHVHAYTPNVDASGSSGHTHTFTPAPDATTAGSGTAHNVMQPSLVCNYIVKA